MSHSSFTTCAAGFGMGGRAGRLALCVVFGCLILSLSEAFAQISGSPDPTRQQKVEQWKQQLNQKGVGEKSKWQAELQDGRKIKGYLSEMREDGFTLVNTKTEEQFRISFADLEDLKRQGTPIWGVAAAIGAAVFGVLVLVGVSMRD